MKNEPSAFGESLSVLSDIIPTQIWEMTDTVNYGRVNSAHAVFLGKKREEIEHKNLYEFLGKAEADICVAQNKLAFRTKLPTVNEEWAFNANHERRLLRIVKTPKLDERGNVLFLSCCAEDITEQHLLEEQNIKKEHILNAIVRFSKELFSENPDAIEKGLATLGEAVQVDRVYYMENHLDASSNAWFSSQKYEWCAAGISRQIDNPELQNVPLPKFSDFIEPLTSNRPLRTHIKNIKSGEIRNMLAAQQAQSILVLPVNFGGAFMGLVGFDSCVCEREWTDSEVVLLETFVELLAKSLQKAQLQEQLSGARQNFANFFSTIDDLLFVLDGEGTILEVNHSVLRKTGYSRTELIGQNVVMLHPADRREEAAAVVRDMLLGTQLSCRIPIETKSGVPFPAITRVCKGEWNKMPVLFGISQDVTRLEFSEELFSKAFHDSLLMKAIVNIENGAHIDANDALCRTLGYAREEIIGKTPFELSMFTSRNDANIVINAFAAKKAIQNAELNVLDKSGSTHAVVMNASPIRIGTMTCIVVSMLDITDRIRLENELKNSNEHLEEIVQDKVQQLADALWGTITALVCLAESRDDSTGGHLRRISETCRVVASALSMNSVYSEQLTREFIINLQQACLLHDIGKVGIPDSILLKRGKLTTEEFDEMKKHTTIGAQTLESAYQHYHKSDLIKMGIEISLSHHERWDGLGYPAGLKGNEIPLSAQIVAICDVYDALRSTRCYKTASSHEDSLAEIRRDIGHRFNPVVAKAFLRYEREIEQIYQGYDL
ncbi:MAG: PAS domain S-box protein [Eubacteriales bacterium]|nr:PAS domain S-box protein [Eubacteriales bacterium]